MSHLQSFVRFGARCASRQLGISRLVTSTTQRPITSLLTRAQPTLVSHTCRTLATKSDVSIGEFLTEEISTEKSNLKKMTPIPGFTVTTDGAELLFTKDLGNEKIIVSLNVNHTVDSAEPDDGTQEAPEMKSKPNFEVDIVKPDGKTLSFSCSYILDHEEQATPEEGFDDLFAIDEVTMFEGENWTEKKYAVAGDILDGYLYDLFMNMLDERGINRDFAEKLSDYCSGYEHSLYIRLLEDLQKFVK